MDMEAGLEEKPEPSAKGLPVILTQQDASSADATVAGVRRSSAPLRCKVLGCTTDLTSGPKTHQRFRLCNTHIKAPVILVDGVSSRFCQQCSRFHPLAEFHGTNRTCRMMLVKNRARQRGGGGGACGTTSAAAAAAARTRSPSPPPLPLVFRASNTTAAAVQPAVVVTATAAGCGAVTYPTAMAAAAAGALALPATEPQRVALDFGMSPVGLETLTSGGAQLPRCAVTGLQHMAPTAPAIAAAAAAALLSSSAPHSPATVVSEALCSLPRTSSALALASGCDGEAAAASAGVAAAGGSRVAPCFARGSSESIGTAAAAQAVSPSPGLPQGARAGAGAGAGAPADGTTPAAQMAAAPPDTAPAAYPGAAWGGSHAAAPCEAGASAGAGATAVVLLPAGSGATASGVGASTGGWQGPRAVRAVSAGPSPFARCSAPPDLCNSGPGTYSGYDGLPSGQHDHHYQQQQQLEAASPWRQGRPDPLQLGLAPQRQQQPQQHQAPTRLRQPSLQRELSLQLVLRHKHQSAMSQGCGGGGGGGGSAAGDGFGGGGGLATPGLGSAGFGDAACCELGGGGLGSWDAASAASAADGLFGRMSAPPGNAAAELRCGSGGGGGASGAFGSCATAVEMVGDSFRSGGGGGGGGGSGGGIGGGGRELHRSGSFGSFKRRRSFGADGAAGDDGAANVRHCSSAGVHEATLDAAIAAVTAAAEHQQGPQERPQQPQPQLPLLRPQEEPQEQQGQGQQQGQQVAPGGEREVSMQCVEVGQACLVLDLRLPSGSTTTTGTTATPESWSPDGAQSHRADSPCGLADGSGGGGGGAAAAGCASPLGQRPLQLAPCPSLAAGPATTTATGDTADEGAPMTPGEATTLFLGALVLDEKVVHGGTASAATRTEPGPGVPAGVNAPCVSAAHTCTVGAAGGMEATAATGAAGMHVAATATAAQCENLMLARLAAEWRCEGGPDCGDELLLGLEDAAAGSHLPQWAQPPAAQADQTATATAPRTHPPMQLQPQPQLPLPPATHAAPEVAAADPRGGCSLAFPSASAAGMPTAGAFATMDVSLAETGWIENSGPEAAPPPPPQLPSSAGGAAIGGAGVGGGILCGAGGSVGGTGGGGGGPQDGAWLRSAQSEPAWWACRPDDLQCLHLMKQQQQEQQQHQEQLQWLSCQSQSQAQREPHPQSVSARMAASLLGHPVANSSGGDSGGGGENGAPANVAVLQMLNGHSPAPVPAPVPAPAAAATVTAVTAAAVTAATVAAATAAAAAPCAPAVEPFPLAPHQDQRRSRGGRRCEQAPCDSRKGRGRGKAVGEETEEQLQLLLGDLLEQSPPAPSAPLVPQQPPPAPPVPLPLPLAPMHQMLSTSAQLQLQQQQEQQQQGFWQQGPFSAWGAGSGALPGPGPVLGPGLDASVVKGEAGADGPAAPLGPQGCAGLGLALSGNSAAAAAGGAAAAAAAGGGPFPLPLQQLPQLKQVQPATQNQLLQPPQACAVARLDGPSRRSRRDGGTGRRACTAAAPPSRDGGSDAAPAPAPALPDREFLDLAMRQQRQLWVELQAMQEQQRALLQQQMEQQRALAQLLQSPSVAAAAAGLSSWQPERQEQQQQQLEGSASCASSQQPRPAPAFGRWSMPVLRDSSSEDASATHGDPRHHHHHLQQQQQTSRDMREAGQPPPFARHSQPPPESHSRLKRQHSSLREGSSPGLLPASETARRSGGGGGGGGGGGDSGGSGRSSSGSEQLTRGSAAATMLQAAGGRDGPSLTHPRLAWLQQQQDL
ncbi:hypothetical protein PLESTF_000244800 [Pleodorina starrii]|nr:hypothetical protein PLESTF_000244800 [Pleodorina starrii]